MDGEETAVRRLRAEGRSYRQIATALGIPLTRTYKLATAAPESAPAEPAEPGAALFQVSTLSTEDLEVGPPVPLPEPPPAPAEPAPAPRGVHLGYLHGPFTMPTPEELAQPYTMPGPGGTVLVITPRSEER